MNKEQRDILNKLRKHRKYILRDLHKFREIEGKNTLRSDWKIRHRDAETWFEDFSSKLYHDIFTLKSFYQKTSKEDLKTMLKAEIRADEVRYE